jgi:predicted RNase H-like HicB family nuclease
MSMKKVLQLTAMIEREGDGYVATCPELDIVSQGGTVEQARLNLLEAVEGFFEVASASEKRSAVGGVGGSQRAARRKAPAFADTSLYTRALTNTQVGPDQTSREVE